MKQSKFSESQIVSMIRLYESGVSVNDICRDNGISAKTFYNWKSKYNGLGTPEIKRLKELEAENAKLKKMYAELSLVTFALKDAMEKKF